MEPLPSSGALSSFQSLRLDELFGRSGWVFHECRRQAGHYVLLDERLLRLVTREGVMKDQLTVFGGSPAITLAQDEFTQWPIYPETEAGSVADLVRNHKLSSAHYNPDSPMPGWSGRSLADGA